MLPCRISITDQLDRHKREEDTALRAYRHECDEKVADAEHRVKQTDAELQICRISKLHLQKSLDEALEHNKYFESIPFYLFKSSHETIQIDNWKSKSLI